MTLTSLNFKEIDALLAVLEMTDLLEMTEIIGEDINEIYEKLSEMRDEV
jgi:hypothetical protein